MGLYDNNLLYAALFVSVLILQAFWILFSSDGLQAERAGKKTILAHALCCICISLAAATLFRLFPGNNRPPAEDSSVFLYIGKRMLEGKLPYRDLFDHKGPILYLIEVSGLSLTPRSTSGVWVLEVLNLLAASFLMLRLGFLEAENRASGFLAVLTAVGICGWKIWQGGNFTEEYALPWITAAALVFFRFFQSGCYRLRDIFLLGFSFSIVFLLRANMVAVWAALLPPVLIRFLWEKRFPDIGKCVVLFLLGAAAVFLPVLLWAGKTGCLSALWEDYILFNFSYTGDAAAQENSILKTALLFAGVVWPGTVAQLICLFFDRRNSRQWLNALFFAVSLLAAGMSARGYYHYAIILLPAMILPLTGFYDLSGRLWCRLFRKPGTVDYRLIVISFLLVAAAAFLYRWVSPGELQEDAAVQALLEKTAPEDDVLVLGNNCWYYLASERKTENRFFYQLPPLEISSELYAAFEKDLDLHPPDTVLLPGREEEREWTDIRLKGIREKLLNRSYSSEAFDEFELFTRNRDAS
ncbi:MAG: hypothetical protein IKF16_03670 [Lachnospiraceae bacterium]|nr:hypothetical protein [Lachnospiraceae bacterium]